MAKENGNKKEFFVKCPIKILLYLKSLIRKLLILNTLNF